MGTQYDENLNQNEFFKQLKANFEDIIRTASENNWIICVPRKGCFAQINLSKSDVCEHILVRNGDEFNNLNGKKIKKDNNKLIYQRGELNKLVQILFYEDFVIKGLKYTIWCIDEFLFGSKIKNDEIIQINNFCDCINLLWNDNLGCYVLDEINSSVQKFLTEFQLQEEFDLKELQSVIQVLYNNCLEVALLSFEERIEDNFLKNLKLAVESFMQACLKDKLFNLICTHTAVNDANINKIIRNSQDVSLKNLGIEKHFEIIPIARLELNKINNSNVILNKIICLKTVFNHFNKTDTEDLLKILIFLIIKSNVFNWIGNLIFIKNFFFSKSDNLENDFLITTLNAAINFIKENRLNDLKLKKDPKNNFEIILTYIKEGDLNKLVNNLSFINKNDLIKKLCHPLCSCDDCEKLLQSNRCEINSPDENGRIFLHHAAKYNHPDVIHFLIIKGSDINSIDYSGWTPLHYAVASGNQHATFLLLHSGCNSNLRDFEGNTPLHIAVKNGHENCVEALLYFTNNNGENVEINCKNNNGDTPLHFASKYGYLNLVKLLIEFGGENLINKRGLTPLSVAHNNFIKDILINTVINDYVVIQTDSFCKENLKKEKIPNKEKNLYIQKDKFNNYLLFGQIPKNLNQIKKTDLLLKAIESNDTPLTCFYIGIPTPNFNQNQTKKNCHPLCVCEKCTKIETTKEIENQHLIKINLNTCNPEGFTPLHVAAKYGRLEILRLLLDSGALINLKTYKCFYTPLHLACINRRKLIVRELLKCGDCLIDVADKFGNTPLHYSVFNNDLEIFEMLLNEGCDVNVKNGDGKNVWNVAEDLMCLSILKILRERDKKVLTNCTNLDFVV